MKIDKIPKIIHYVWIGGKPKPESVLKCIETWKKFCPDYEIVEWNENNFDIYTNQYIREAYAAKKFAFASDYMRLYVLYNHGGIYMDTDVEIIKPIDKFLNNTAFSGFENACYIPTAIMGAVKGSRWIKLLLDYYNDRSFYLNNGNMDLKTNVETITEITYLHYPIKFNNSYQEFKGLTIYPRDYFCPKSYVTLKIRPTENTHVIHNFAGTWLPNNAKFGKKILKGFMKVMPASLIDKLANSFLKKKLKKKLSKLDNKRQIEQ